MSSEKVRRDNTTHEREIHIEKDSSKNHKSLRVFDCDSEGFRKSS